MSVESEIGQWDGKYVNDLGAIYERHRHEKSFISEVISLMKITTLQKGATWLIKLHLENKNQLTHDQAVKICDQLLELRQWESKLHILQCLPFMEIPKSQKGKVEIFLRNCLSDSNKFIRAWAYNGFYELAMQYPEHKKETKQFFEMAMRDEPPSVKSRIRNIMKKGF